MHADAPSEGHKYFKPKARKKTKPDGGQLFCGTVGRLMMAPALATVGDSLQHNMVPYASEVGYGG